MIKLARSTAVCCLCFGVLVIASKSWAQTRPPILEKVAKTYGLDSWNRIEAIRYTFNFQFGKVNITRSWEWEPKTTQVTYEAKDKDGKRLRVSYKRSDLESQPESVKSEVDPGFINDNYTLLFPLKAYWDSSPAVIDAGMYNVPVGSGSGELVGVKYPPEGGGYTPGDTWELYVAKSGRIEYWVYHRGGSKKPSLLFATWGNQKKAGPILISTDRQGFADGKPIHIWFSDVAVKVTGSNAWIAAQ